MDLGFGIQVAWPKDEVVGCREGGCATVERTEGGGYRTRAEVGRRAAYYSYGARVIDVIDGDTVWLDIDCGFHVWTRQKVRLRGIDTPELGTAEGQRAKDFVVQALTGLPSVAVTTTKPDKYDRYLADIFYKADSRGDVLRYGPSLPRGPRGGPTQERPENAEERHNQEGVGAHRAEAVLEEGTFLNRALVEARLATRL